MCSCMRAWSYAYCNYKMYVLSQFLLSKAIVVSKFYDRFHSLTHLVCKLPNETPGYKKLCVLQSLRSYKANWSEGTVQGFTSTLAALWNNVQIMIKCFGLKATKTTCGTVKLTTSVCSQIIYLDIKVLAPFFT